MRWGIEAAFRALKHTLGLLHFHAKKVEFIRQEVFARLIMYNYIELVTSHVIIRKAKNKYADQANYSVAVHKAVVRFWWCHFTCSPRCPPALTQ